MGKFIVVDDSKVIRALLRSILENAGHEVLAEGSNGLEGFDLYREHRPDVITLDINMPINNGIRCLENIITNFPDAKVIMVTSIGKDVHVEKAMSLGAKAYLVKPLEEYDVLTTVDIVLGNLPQLTGENYSKEGSSSE